METPNFEHLTPEDYEFVYEPSQDSFLLLDALEADLQFLHNFNPLTCVEIGSGSGIIITALSKRLKNSFCIGIDINPYACRTTKRTAAKNITSVDVINMDLLSSFKANSIDLLVFNPPYVVTPDIEVNQNINENSITQTQLVKSWAGGVNGRLIIDKLIKNLSAILAINGVLYLLVLKENNPDDIILQLKCLKYEAIKFMERRIPGEHLYILKVTRKS